jgi:Domain of unknown function (DUF4383)
MATAERTSMSARTPAQTFALVFGVVYLLVGIAGFFVTGFDDFASEVYNEKLILFPVNPLHNIVHILIGAMWIGGSRTHAMAKSVNVFIGAAYLLVAILGLAGILNFLSIKDAGSTDNYLHLVSGLLSLGFGTIWAGGDTVVTTRETV